MTKEKIAFLEQRAKKVREHIIKMSVNGGCFIGASLSCADLIVYLYSSFLNINRNNLNHPSRDYLFLSKGHDVPALYGTFAEMNFIDENRLKSHLLTTDFLYWHPNRNIPGVEFHSGSLGHLPAVALGVALDCKIRNHHNKVLVITGDGELNEGSVWEAVLVACAKKLNNLTFVIDRNHFQANIATEELIPLEPIKGKFEAFGCVARQIDGHNFTELDDAFQSLPFSIEAPSVIIAETKRGKGLPSIEERADRWFCNFTTEEAAFLIEELYGRGTTLINSQPLTVR